MALADWLEEGLSPVTQGEEAWSAGVGPPLHTLVNICAFFFFLNCAICSSLGRFCNTSYVNAGTPSQHLKQHIQIDI